jgi:NTE family protein
MIFGSVTIFSMFDWLFGKKKIGLALGGGVARGIAHIGVLKIFEKHKLPIKCLAATSSGAIIAAAYAAGLETRLIEEIALRISWGKLLKITFFKPGFIASEAIEEMLIQYLGDLKFSDLKLPLAVVAADLKSGAEVVIKAGRVARAVTASSAVPGIFAPVELDGKFLVDGGLGNNLPVDVVKQLGANYCVAVDVVPSRPVRNLPADAFQAYGRAFDIVMHKLSVINRQNADLLIEPTLGIDEDIWHLDVSKAKKLIAAGEQAAQAVINRLKRLV